MISFLKKLLKDDTPRWRKVSALAPGMKIAVPGEDGEVLWDTVTSITPVGREHVYDIEVEGTHNFVGNDIFAHNTVVFKANGALAVTGEVDANDFFVPVQALTSILATTGTTTPEIPSAILSADGQSVSILRFATYNLGAINNLSENLLGLTTRVDSLEARITKLEDGSIAVASGSPITLSTSTIAAALQNFGILIQNGIAQFDTLVARRFVAATDSNGNSIAGSGTILSGNTVTEINNPYVMATSKVLVTITSSSSGSWFVTDKQDGSFRVKLAEAQDKDVTFDYFIIETEGQLATPMAAKIQAEEGDVVSSKGDTATTTVNTEPTITMTDTVATTTTQGVGGDVVSSKGDEASASEGTTTESADEGVTSVAPETPVATPDAFIAPTSSTPVADTAPVTNTAPAASDASSNTPSTPAASSAPAADTSNTSI